MARALTHTKGRVEIIPPRKAGAPMGNLNRIKNQPRFITQALVMRLLQEVEDPRLGKNSREKKQRRRLVDWLVDMLITLAFAGDTTALKMIIDRVEGSPHATMLFKPISEDEDEDTIVSVTRERLAQMSPEQRLSLYNATLSDQSGVEGSA